jgi:hypothetical protein
MDVFIIKIESTVARKLRWKSTTSTSSRVLARNMLPLMTRLINNPRFTDKFSIGNHVFRVGEIRLAVNQSWIMREGHHFMRLEAVNIVARLFMEIRNNRSAFPFENFPFSESSVLLLSCGIARRPTSLVISTNTILNFNDEEVTKEFHRYFKVDPKHPEPMKSKTAILSPKWKAGNRLLFSFSS